MPRGKSTQDTTLLSMALVGYEAEKQRIEDKIQEIRSMLTGTSVATRGPAKKKVASATVTPGAPVKRRTLSAAARKRIAVAQKKRWAEHRKKIAAGGE